MSDFDILFPMPTGGRNADDMGMPSGPVGMDWERPVKECPNCKGNGRVGVMACNHCGATGRVALPQS